MSSQAEPRAAEVERLGQEWAAAEMRGDIAFLGEILTDDFVGVGPRGFVLTREQWLARFESGLRYDSFGLSEVRVRLYGDAAVATGRQSQAGEFQGHDAGGEFRATLVFVKQEGRRLLAGTHLSPITEMPAGG